MHQVIQRGICRECNKEYEYILEPDIILNIEKYGRLGYKARRLGFDTVECMNKYYDRQRHD